MKNTLEHGTNSDWYLRGLNTYDEYHGLNKGDLNIGELSDNQLNEYTGCQTFWRI